MASPSRSLQTKEKQKWQIALRRYVIEKHPNAFYAPYFGLDVANFRKWIEAQFEEGLSWDNFNASWQFDFVVPLIYFDLALEKDLVLAWNFLNIRVSPVSVKDHRSRSDLLFAKSYFTTLLQTLNLQMCRRMLEKIADLEQAQSNPEPQSRFLLENRALLEQLQNYGPVEFELLNHGRSPEEIEKEAAILKKLQ